MVVQQSTGREIMLILKRWAENSEQNCSQSWTPSLPHAAAGSIPKPSQLIKDPSKIQPSLKGAGVTSCGGQTHAQVDS